jgi:lysophospholipase L1-like esterase
MRGTLEMIQEPTSREPKMPLSFGKSLLFRVISIVLVFGLMCCLGELGLRILPLGKYRSAPFRQYDSQLGLSLIPNRHLIHSRGCFQGEVSINRWGMRDRDRTLEKPPGEFRIAMVGDSGVEAVQVKPDEVVNIRMEKLLRDKGYRNIEILSFGVEGIGTTQELLLYEQKVRQFHPDLVLLMFSDNDVFNNSSTLQPKVYGIHDWYAPYYNLLPDGELVFQPVEHRYFEGPRSYLEDHSVLFYYLERTWLRLDVPLYKWQGLPLFYGTYSDDPIDDEWKQAWLVTEKVMQKMRDTVAADGAQFLVLPWPTFTSTDPHWRQTMIARFGHVPAAFSPYKLQERLRGIADRSHIRLAFFDSYMQRYRDEHHLQWPYFSFTCDPHFNAVGHEVSAEAIVQKLGELNLLPPNGQ